MILQLVPSTGYARFPPLNYGGVEGFVYETSKQLAERRNIGVLYGGPEVQKPDIVAKDGFKTFRTPLTRFPESTPLSLVNIQVSLANNAFAAARLFGIANTLHPAMLHLHESHTQFLIAKYCKAPKVFTFHGSHTCVPYARQTLHARMFAWKADGYAAKYCDHLIAICNLSRKNILEYTGFSKEDVSVVHYGVDTLKFTPVKDAGRLKAKLGPDAGPILICVTRVARDKGLDLTLRAISALKKEFPRLLCIFCGVSPRDLNNSAHGRQLLDMVAKDGLEKNVLFPGKISRDDLPGYLSLADVFVHPARVEAFGLAVGEAMACAKPAVCMENSGGPDDMIADGKNGFLCRRESAEDIAEKTRYLLDNPKAMKAFGRHARETIAKDFSWEAASQKLLWIYDSIS